MEVGAFLDYRKLNNVTKEDVYPLPRIFDTLDCLKGTKFFSSMDLCSGYWQIEVDEADREKTAFILYSRRNSHRCQWYGIGAVLVQIQNKAEKAIAYASRTLTKAEKNYSITERECRLTDSTQTSHVPFRKLFVTFIPI
ncbi:hypothetical protein AVEN_91348-1 [Araneus ventricosus]|uniref:Uncharacterized protein n=1 Tax=Araneus ventricosus TaxID=182803 RepID=A0A4Y2PAH2_ARAVE|nr:hypothetical protein AVEN_91348-1 [Araneus ventricosus]